MKNFDNKKDQSHTLFDDDDSLVNMLWSTIEEDNEDSDQLERDYIDLKNRINRKEKTIRITKYRWIGGIAASLIVVFMLLNIYQRNNTPDNVYAKIQDIEKSVIPDQVILSSNDGLSVVLDEAAIIEGSENNCHVLLTSSGVKKDIKATEILKITVPDGRQFMLTLSDGSKVWLNSGSELEYPATFIGQTYRKVKLNGEAFFDIMPDKETPFYVETVQERIFK